MDQSSSAQRPLQVVQVVYGGFHSHGGTLSMDGLFHGKSQEVKSPQPSHPSLTSSGVSNCMFFFKSRNGLETPDNPFVFSQDENIVIIEDLFRKNVVSEK